MLSLLFALERKGGTPWPEQKPTAVFAAVALFYSGGAIAVQLMLFSDDGLLVGEYLGRRFSLK